MWPTPCTTDAKNVPYQKGPDGKRYPMLLGAVAPERMWPTPVAGDANIAAPNQNVVSLGREIRRQEGSGQLNPTWVEWLMGYPSGWTDLEG
jgi:DNA (cytosine-5)-methyltransferase 1